MTTRSKNSTDKLRQCSSTGQVARWCCCIHHDEWVKNNSNFNLINLVKDKSKTFSKSIENKSTRCIPVVKTSLVQRLAMKILQLNKVNKSKVNLKPTADTLPVGVISSMLIYKIMKNEEENDENINIAVYQIPRGYTIR